jgi:hypothetical protein
MLLDGVTINDGKDSLAGVCATPICVDRRIAGIAVEAIRPVAIMVDKRLRAERYRVGMKAISRRDEGADDGCRHETFRDVSIFNSRTCWYTDFRLMMPSRHFSRASKRLTLICQRSRIADHRGKFLSDVRGTQFRQHDRMSAKRRSSTQLVQSSSKD